MPRKPVTPDLSHIAEQLRPLAVPMSDLRLDPKNAREHSAANLTAIAASLREFGQVKPLVVNAPPDSKPPWEIEAGNGTYLAARTLGWTHVAAVKVQHDAAGQRGFSLADNRTAELATWNQQVLDELLLEVRTESQDLYVELQLAQLESVAQVVEEPKTKTRAAIPDTWAVVVSCSGEADQKAFLARMQAEKRKCRLLVL